MRFNPPPTWPEPPIGWYPPPGWQPPAEWGPMPLGWPLWVGDGPNGYVTSTPASRGIAGLAQALAILFLVGFGAVVVLLIAYAVHH